MRSIAAWVEMYFNVIPQRRRDDLFGLDPCRIQYGAKPGEFVVIENPSADGIALVAVLFELCGGERHVVSNP